MNYLKSRLFQVPIVGEKLKQWRRSQKIAEQREAEYQAWLQAPEVV